MKYLTCCGLLMLSALIPSIVFAQSSPNFTNGPPPVSALRLNEAFEVKSDYPYVGPLSPSSFSSLPAATNLSAADRIVVLQQSGVLALATLGQISNLFGLVLPTIDFNFVAGTYSGLNCNNLTACLSASNNGGYAQWNDGHWSAFAANTARVTDQGLLYESTATNVILSSRDMTQGVWTKTNTTALLNAVGIDNTPSAATTLTATSSNGTSCQTAAITLSSFNETTFSIFAKRIIGTGEVDIALEPAPGHSGTVYQPITVANSFGALNNTWQRFTYTIVGITSPVTVCVRIVSNGDAVAFDFAQAEPQVWATSPILTTATTATRQTDAVSFTLAANTLLNSSSVSAIFTTGGAAAGNFRHQISSPYFGGSGTAEGYLWQFGAMASFFNPGSAGAGTPPYTICGSTSNLAANQSMALPAIFGVAWGSTGTPTLSCDGGSLYYPAGLAPSSPQTWFVGGATAGPTAYTKDIKLYAQTLTAIQLQGLTLASNNVIVTDTSPASTWEANYTTANTGFSIQVGGTLPPFSGMEPPQNSYGAATGPGIYGVTAPLQLGGVGNYARFNMYANNCSLDDDCMTGSYGGSERTELDGSTGAMGDVQFASATDAWFSYSMCIEPGAPLTSNWFFTGQVHQTINPVGGGSPPFAMNTIIGETGQAEFVTDANQGTITRGNWRQLRGVWYNYVLQLNFDPTGAQGKINIWQNGTQIVAYTGVTGETPPTGTQQYYWKFGIYRGQSPEYEAVRYANMTYSASTLSAKIASPDAIPSGYGTICQ